MGIRAFCTAAVAAGVAVLVTASPSPAAVVDCGITVDGYIDSRNPSNNYGAATTAKVVINSTDLSDGSKARGLFALPSALWTYPQSQVSSAVVCFYVFNDGNSGGRGVTLNPLSSPYTAGTGNGSATGNGATWLTRDGVNNWTAAGGDFDAAFTVSGVRGADLGGGARYFTWDITALLNDPTARAELQTNGAILRIDETPYTGSPSSGLRDPFSSFEDSQAVNRPYLEMTLAVPEPATMLLVGTASLALLRFGRRRRGE